jgi:hypothetical protein
MVHHLNNTLQIDSPVHEQQITIPYFVKGGSAHRNKHTVYINLKVSTRVKVPQWAILLKRPDVGV